MMFWSYMLLIVLMVPAVMFFTGMFLRKHSPKAPSGIWGYRTALSTKNQETWDYANRYMARIWFHWGLILLPLSVVPMLFFLGAPAETVSAAATVEVLVQLIPIGVSIYLTEKALRKKFRQDGTPREEPA